MFSKKMVLFIALLIVSCGNPKDSVPVEVLRNADILRDRDPRLSDFLKDPALITVKM